MKKFLPFLSLAVLIACNSKPSETETRTIPSAQATTLDTAGLAQFQQWKAQNELATANETQQAQKPASVEPTKTVTVIREVRVPQTAPARRPEKRTPQPVAQAPVSSPAPAQTGNSSSSGEATAKSESSGTADAPATQPGQTAKDKGWSSSAKGAVIGGAGGAVLGAIINKKNRAAGAVIGGVLGAGVGYGVGKNKDNKASKDLQMH